MSRHLPGWPFLGITPKLLTCKFGMGIMGKGAHHPAMGNLEGQIIVDNLWVLEGRRFVPVCSFKPTSRFESQAKPVLRTL